MAYGAIAGLPLVVGLYTALVPLLVYAVMGTSRPVSVTTSSTIALLSLEARDDTERALKAQAVSLTVEPGQLQSLMQAEATTTISKPMLVVVVLWLVMIFLSFSLIAPPNATANFALIASALCPAGAILLILKLNRPFGGLMRIASEPMLNVLRPPGE